MIELVIDSSVAVKWVVAEPDSNLAASLFSEVHRFVVPDFIMAEVANVLWKKVRRLEIDMIQAMEAIHRLPTYFDVVVNGGDYVKDALRMAVQLEHPVYDCLYLAIAAARTAILVTADRRLAERCERAGITAVLLSQHTRVPLELLGRAEMKPGSST